MPTSTPPTEIAPAQVLRRFRVVFNAVRTHFHSMEKQAGIGGAQVWALSVIEKHPGLGVGNIARHMQVHQTTASNLVKGLVEKSMVKVEKASHDKRGTHLTILPAGVVVLQKTPGPFEGVLPRALASLDKDTLARLNVDLEKLIQVLQADESASETPLANL